MSHRKQAPCAIRRPGIHWLLLGCLAAGSAAPALADQNIGSATFNSYFGLIFETVPSLTETARLDFKINIDKMIYLRVGAGGNYGGGISGTGPAPSGAVSTVTLDLSPSIPASGTIPSSGSNQGVNWNTGLPTFLAATPVVLPVEVRSNAGAVSISGQVTTPLTSGGNTIPMSSVTISSSDANLPAPTLPNSGTGTPVNVTPGGAGTAAAPALLTYRTANWSFGFTPTASLIPGAYSGSVTFTATAL